MPASPQLAAQLRAFICEARAWKREMIYREMIEVFHESGTEEPDPDAHEDEGARDAAFRAEIIRLLQASRSH